VNPCNSFGGRTFKRNREARLAGGFDGLKGRSMSTNGAEQEREHRQVRWFVRDDCPQDAMACRVRRSNGTEHEKPPGFDPGV
jgi:hypothetical protein